MTPNRTLAAVSLGLALASAAPARAAAPCLGRVAFEPVSPFVGQQTLYRVHIETLPDARVEWDAAPAFPSFRAERLPGRPAVPSDAAGPSRASAYRAREEQRALFPERDGVLAIPPATLRCAHAGETSRVSVPGAELRVRALPRGAAANAATDLIGPLAVRADADRRSLALGESARVTVVLRGRHNLWDAAAPLSEADFGDADVFARPPQLTFERGVALGVRREFAWDVVPRAVGTLRIPGARVHYFEPDDDADQGGGVGGGEFRHADADPIELAVSAARAASQPRALQRGPEPASGGATRAERARSWALGIAAFLLVALIGGVAWRRGAGAHTAAAASEDVGADSDLGQVTRALRAALDQHVRDAASQSAEELLAIPGLPEPVSAAVRLLAAAERARFDPGATGPSAAAVKAAIARLRAAP